MKRIIVFLLILTLLMPMLPARAETVAVKPYYGLGSSDFNRTKFPNLEGRQTISVVVENGEVYLAYSGAGRDVNRIAAAVKTKLDAYPEGMRSFVLFRISDVFQPQEDAIYFEECVEKLKAVFSQFIKAYAEIGGKLDSIVLDLEYVDVYAWYLYSKQYTKGNKDVYKNIVENPLYQTEVRPLLVERGFKFYGDASKPEIWSIYPRLKGTEAEEYAISQTVWATVMRIRLNNYLTEAIYEPLAQHMPGVRVYDYQSRNTYAWLKDLNDKGEHNYVAGNSVAVGVTSHYNTYGSRLSNEFFTVDDQPVYKNPVAFNGAEFAATPFNRILWDVNLMKNMYEASGGNVSITVAEYDYSPNKVGTPSNTPYYTESIFHIGLLDPEPFCIYMYDGAFETTTAYNKRAKVLQEIMAELTRVAGCADREPIPVLATWNSSFLLSGIYANGRNLWRFTPDDTKIDPMKFVVSEDDPAFYINGQTITFPQGKIIPDGTVSVVGTYGYWIETPKDVTPIVTTDADRYSKYPSFAENFESYPAGTAFDGATATQKTCWTVEGTNPVVQTAGAGNALALTGTTTLSNVKLPENITAGDYYAKQQSWEVSVTLPDTFSGELKLLACGDGGIKIADGKVYYDAGGSYKEMSGVKLSAGQKYTLKRKVDFRNTYQCDYTVLDSAGKVIGQATAIPMANISLPVTKIALSCTNVTGQVLIDDYKLYPIGVTTDFEVYNAQTGIRQTGVKSSENVAYRLSWLNGSDETENREVVATFYDANSKQASQEVIQQVQMNPGCDGVETGIVEVPQGQIVTLQMKKVKPTSKPATASTINPTTADKPTESPTSKPTEEPTVKPTEGQTVQPTQGQTAKPTESQTVRPTGGQSTKPTTGPTVKPTVQQIVRPSAGQTGKPSSTPTNEPVVPTGDGETVPATIPVILPTGGDENLPTGAVPTAVPTQAPAETEVTAAPSGAISSQPPTEEPRDGKGSGKTVLWIVISVATLSGAGAATYFLYFKKKKF